MSQVGKVITKSEQSTKTARLSHHTSHPKGSQMAGEAGWRARTVPCWDPVLFAAASLELLCQSQASGFAGTLRCSWYGWLNRSPGSVPDKGVRTYVLCARSAAAPGPVEWDTRQSVEPPPQRQKAAMEIFLHRTPSPVL